MAKTTPTKAEIAAQVARIRERSANARGVSPFEQKRSNGRPVAAPSTIRPRRGSAR